MFIQTSVLTSSHHRYCVIYFIETGSHLYSRTFHIWAWSQHLLQDRMRARVRAFFGKSMIQSVFKWTADTDQPVLTYLLICFRLAYIHCCRNCCAPFHIQSTLVISNSKGLSITLRDTLTSKYQSCRSEENNKSNNHI